jgi:hypothetical protein
MSIEILLDLSEQKEELIHEKNEQMYDLLQDNVVAAFYELFELAEERIEWLDIDVLTDASDEELLVVHLTFVVSYFNDEASEYAQALMGVSEDPSEENVRIVKYTFPLELCEDSKESCMDFIIEYSNINTHAAGQPSDHGFNVTELTDEQQEKLKMFENMSKGIN